MLHAWREEFIVLMRFELYASTIDQSASWQRIHLMSVDGCKRQSEL
jgi:hypothetical protein